MINIIRSGRSRISYSRGCQSKRLGCRGGGAVPLVQPLITFSLHGYQSKRTRRCCQAAPFNRNLHVFTSLTGFLHVDHSKSFVCIRTPALLPEAVRLSQILSFCSSISILDFKNLYYSMCITRSTHVAMVSLKLCSVTRTLQLVSHGHIYMILNWAIYV